MSWDLKPLDEVVEHFIDYRGKTPNKTNQGIPLITAKIVKDGRLLEANEYIAEEDYDDWMTRGYPEIDDVVLTTEAPLGEVALIKDKNVALAQRIITLRGYRDKLDNKFLKYWFQSEYGQYELDSRASGTTVFGIKASVLKKVPVPVPPLPEQKAIASVLSSLDDKIDLLHRQNKTLEAMAETLFRHWFIEEAKEDWTKVTLGDVVNITSSKRIFYSEYVDEGIPFYRSKEIIELNKSGQTSSELFISNERFNEIESKFGAPREGDILLTSVGTLGVTYQVKASDRFYFKDGNLTWFKDFKRISSNIIFCWLNSKDGKEQLDNISIGSTQAALTIQGLKSLGFTLPSSDVIRKLDEKLAVIYQKINANQRQIQTLENLRDTLLPKLMSGEVRVQYQTEEVA